MIVTAVALKPCSCSRLQVKVLRWAEHSVRSLESRGPQVLEQDLVGRLKAVVKSGLDVRTDYSGLGSAEESTRHIMLALQKLHGLAPGEGRVCCRRAGDLSGVCRSLLLHHVGPTKPRCVQGDICERIPARLRSQLEKLRQTHIKKMERRVLRGQDRAAAIDIEGQAFMQKAGWLLLQRRHMQML